MAAPDPAYAAYLEWGGALPEDAYVRSLPRAVSEVGRRIWPNDPAADRAAWQRAVFAAVDVCAAYGAGAAPGALASVSAGSVSMSFSGGSAASAYAADMRRAVDAEIAGSPLAFMGIGG